jgi:hypothetical protein
LAVAFRFGELLMAHSMRKSDLKPRTGESYLR